MRQLNFYIINEGCMSKGCEGLWLTAYRDSPAGRPLARARTGETQGARPSPGDQARRERSLRGSEDRTPSP
jgi:hypothetical protein